VITTLLTALASLPKIASALERLGDLYTIQVARSRKTDKDELVKSMLNDVIKRRTADRVLDDSEVSGVERDNSGPSEGV